MLLYTCISKLFFGSVRTLLLVSVVEMILMLRNKDRIFVIYFYTLYVVDINISIVFSKK